MSVASTMADQLRGQPVKVVVWIPVYKQELSLPELLSLYQTAMMLKQVGSLLAGKFQHIEFLTRLSNDLPNASVKAYPDSTFSSVSSYCNLLLSPRFYAEFGSAHLLIVQLDAWICGSDFQSFLSYDYVAPPFFPYPLEPTLAKARCIGVGVGGLSLRSAPALHAALKQGLSFYEKKVRKRTLATFNLKGKLAVWFHYLLQRIANIWSPYPSSSPGLTALNCNEDWVIGIYCFNRLQVAGRSVAVRFGLDAYTAEYLELLKPSLPFGLHGWYRDRDRLADCREVLLSTLQPGWSVFLERFGYRFREDCPQELFNSIAALLE